MPALARLLDIGPGEGRRVLALWTVGLAYATATGLVDTVSQSVFVARAGAANLAQIMIAKGLIDMAASALYVPLTRGRSPRRVLDAALGIYAAAALGGRLLMLAGGVGPAYALFIAHECASTVLTIHWGVYVLDVFDAAQARRLFPAIFTAARLGGMVGGLTLEHLAPSLGALNVLPIAAGLSLAAIPLTGRTTGTAGLPADRPEPSPAPGPTTTAAVTPLARLASSFQASWSSPLVRAIACSTAAMVFVRYGLRLLGLAAIEGHFAGDENQVAVFLGRYASIANGVAVVLGLFVTPRLLAIAGVGVANLAYAVATLGAYALLALRPSLTAAVMARFVDTELKDALKTPLSALFYGAEHHDRRPAARAFIFGVAIPAATLVTSAVFQLSTAWHGLRLLTWIGLVVAAAFVLASAWQNRAWKARMRGLLADLLARTPAPAVALPAAPAVVLPAVPAVAAAGGAPSAVATPAAVAPPPAGAAAPPSAGAAAPPSTGAAALPPALATPSVDPAAVLAWRGLGSPDPAVRAVASEVLAISLPRRQARVLLERGRRELPRV